MKCGNELHVDCAVNDMLRLGLKLIGDVFFKRLVQRDKVTADDFETKLCKFHHELIMLSFAPCLIQKQETKI